MLNLGSVFNTAILSQGNLQLGANTAVFSPYARQTLVQGASAAATVIQIG